MQRSFPLPKEDKEFLGSLGYSWETLSEGNARWLILRGYPIRWDYNHEAVDVAYEILPSYPDTQIDMAYFYPPLARRDGAGIGALASRVIEGKSWQRWSRHRTSASAWRPGIDSVATHFHLMESWLEREFLKKAS